MVYSLLSILHLLYVYCLVQISTFFCFVIAVRDVCLGHWFYLVIGLNWDRISTFYRDICFNGLEATPWGSVLTGWGWCGSSFPSIRLLTFRGSTECVWIVFEARSYFNFVFQFLWDQATHKIPWIPNLRAASHFAPLPSSLYDLWNGKCRRLWGHTCVISLNFSYLGLSSLEIHRIWIIKITDGNTANGT